MDGNLAGYEAMSNEFFVDYVYGYVVVFFVLSLESRSQIHRTSSSPCCTPCAERDALRACKDLMQVPPCANESDVCTNAARTSAECASTDG